MKDSTALHKAEQGYLLLASLKPLAWREDEVYFSKEETGGPDFLKIFKQYQQYAKATRRDYQSESYSLESFDPWKSRRLGASINGKLLSNTYWYVCLTQVHGQWEVFGWSF